MEVANLAGGLGHMTYEKGLRGLLILEKRKAKKRSSCSPQLPKEHVTETMSSWTGLSS